MKCKHIPICRWNRLYGVCRKCGADISLGPANDTPDALVELRAAEIADVARCFGGVAFKVDLVTNDEFEGWIGYMANGNNSPERTDKSWHAGWLARAIFLPAVPLPAILAHDAQQPPGEAGREGA